uniref:Venom cub domain protein 3 n=1 Tax=Pristhesancus plagipennis TaxID=1955184 RepID=A0A1Q1NPA3_PRIPG|nr:venom cub domain protein 3 [Pristhesancus plagipennis]
MNSAYLLVLVLGAATAAITEHRITVKLSVPKGASVQLVSLDYPNIPAAGTTNTWYLTSEEGSKIELTCDDIWVAPSKLCERGWFKVVAGGKTDKFCEMRPGYTATSESNEMTVQIDLNNTTGRARCTAKAV